MTEARIRRVTGALVEAAPAPGVALAELARVGHLGLVAEVIRVAGDRATLQVYEDTTGLAVGEPVAFTGDALTIRLGPGLLGSILDGLGRPLPALAAASGEFMRPGSSSPTLDPARRWRFEARAREGEAVAGGDALGAVEEGAGSHLILVPPDVAGTVAEIESGDYGPEDPIGRLSDGTPLLLSHAWPVRIPRPVARRLPEDRPMVTGQRVFDLLFPVAEGGSVAVPGGFGTGKTIIEQSLAKFADADIVVYVGCGERGNEMAEVLAEFPHLVDERTGRAAMARTVMVVNTSNMPVAAREASVYVGMTIAEYFRDQGRRVALLADSLSRWAEALREISSRLQDMPGEEGYPTDLASRLGRFCERVGRAEAVGRPAREGALTLIGAISPPGGDFSEPVTQAALRVSGAVWALDPSLAHQRQFPAVDWETSYSLYLDRTDRWFSREVAEDWVGIRQAVVDLLQRGRELQEIAALVGPEALQDEDRLRLEMAGLLREAVLGQSAFDPRDAASAPEKTHRLASLGMGLHRAAERVLESGRPFESLNLGPARRALLEVRDASAEERETRIRAAEEVLRGIGEGESGNG